MGCHQALLPRAQDIRFCVFVSDMSAIDIGSRGLMRDRLAPPATPTHLWRGDRTSLKPVLTSRERMVRNQVST